MTLLQALFDSIANDAPVREVASSRNWIAVWSRLCGLAATFAFTPDSPVLPDTASLKGKSALELARRALSDDPLDAALGVAALNSLIEVDTSRCEELNGRDLILKEGKEKDVALVGHFPFVPELRDVARRLSVLELRPHPGDLPASDAQRILPESEVIAITGSAFVNHTIEPLLGYCRPRALVIVIGPSTPLSPVLFDFGVDVISGVRVVDPPRLLDAVGSGAGFREMKGVRRLTMRR